MQSPGGVCACELTLAARATSPLSSPRGMELLLANPEAWLALISKYLEIEDAALRLVCKCRKNYGSSSVARIHYSCTHQCCLAVTAPPEAASRQSSNMDKE